MRRRVTLASGTIVNLAALVACSGAGGGGTANPSPGPTPSPTPPISTQQLIRLALPTEAIGVQTDPTYGRIAGFTQQTFSQILAFAPGSQVMIENAEDLASGTPHTLGVLSTTSFPASQGNLLSTTPAGGSTLNAGFQTGTLKPGQIVGPITLQQGTYFIGCFYHYAVGMRDVLIVQSGATPGPQATIPPGASTPGPGPGGY